MKTMCAQSHVELLYVMHLHIPSTLKTQVKTIHTELSWAGYIMNSSYHTLLNPAAWANQMPGITNNISAAQNNKQCNCNLKKHVEIKQLEKNSLNSIPKSILLDFRVLTNSNWLASENCFVRFSDMLWRPNPSRWKASAGSTSGLRVL